MSLSCCLRIINKESEVDFEVRTKYFFEWAAGTGKEKIKFPKSPLLSSKKNT